jgi:hypothetical protein
MWIRNVSNRLVLLCRIFPPHVGLPLHISRFLLFGTPVLDRLRLGTGISNCAQCAEFYLPTMNTCCAVMLRVKPSLYARVRSTVGSVIRIGRS